MKTIGQIISNSLSSPNVVLGKIWETGNLGGRDEDMYPVRIIFSLPLYVSLVLSIALALYGCLQGDGIGKVGARE